MSKKPVIKPLTQRPAWKALGAHHKKIAKLHLRELFAADKKRGEKLTAEAAGLFLDYSKNRITAETLKAVISAVTDLGKGVENLGKDAGKAVGANVNKIGKGLGGLFNK